MCAMSFRSVSTNGVRYPTVLLGDEVAARRAAVGATVAGSGWLLRDAASLRDLVSMCRATPPGAVLLGCDARSYERVVPVLDAVRTLDAPPPVLLIVEDGSEALAVAALRAGVADYLHYPVDGRELCASLRRCVGRDGAPVSASAPHPQAAAAFVGSSRAMRQVESFLGHVAQGDANVLITGETGTGKELAAAYLHQRSARRRREFIAVNCAAIPDALLESELFGHEKGAFTGASQARPGLLESASGGTVFLDEIGEMGLQAQAKILRAIEAREVYRVGGRSRVPLDVRIVAATNQDLEEAVDAGRFRKDLYYRLHVASVRLPPLRERPGDIGELLDHYLREFNLRGQARIALSADVRRALESYDWPGNVRELKNLVETLMVYPCTSAVGVSDLPESIRRKLERFCTADVAERRALMDALLVARWNKSRAAEILDCSRMTLYRRMAKYSVERTRS
jgi:DNA-binding NtrC family response regulator